MSCQKKQALKEKDMTERTLNVRHRTIIRKKNEQKKKYARNTFVTPVFERSGKYWESLKTTVLLQILIKLVVKNVMPKGTGIKRKRHEGKNVKCERHKTIIQYTSLFTSANITTILFWFCNRSFGQHNHLEVENVMKSWYKIK